MRAAEHAPSDSYRVLEGRDGLADIVERGVGILSTCESSLKNTCQKMYLSVLWWALAEASVEPRAKPSVFIYDAKTLFGLGRSGALQWDTRHDLHHV